MFVDLAWLGASARGPRAPVAFLHCSATGLFTLGSADDVIAEGLKSGDLLLFTRQCLMYQVSEGQWVGMEWACGVYFPAPGPGNSVFSPAPSFWCPGCG